MIDEATPFPVPDERGAEHAPAWASGRMGDENTAAYLSGVADKKTSDPAPRNPFVDCIWEQ